MYLNITGHIIQIENHKQFLMHHNQDVFPRLKIQMLSHNLCLSLVKLTASLSFRFITHYLYHTACPTSNGVGFWKGCYLLDPTFCCQDHVGQYI